MATFEPLLATSAEIDFNRDIRPILSDRCYFCHGPDEEKREAELRFDLPDGATEVLTSGEFVRRIFSDDPDEMMPPPSTKLSLTAAEKELLKAWIASGAQYAAHWAFQPLPAKVVVPTAQNQAWPQQPFDAFVLAKLEAEKLQPTRAADPLRWLRRVTFDLTGLPPSAITIEAFQRALAADADAAYEANVDRLLASPAYGEQMAVAWLDAARYADSYGYQSDKLNTQWPYRDWVIEAFNDNLPYDKFLIWQLAGDLLDKPTREQRLATAFNRIHRLNNEGGAVFEEWRIENVADRVHTFGTAVLGLTMECSRCHDHKYDPITMRDYYSLSAFFNSIDENGLYDHADKVPSPTMLLPTTEQEAALETATKNLVAAEATFHDATTSAAQRRSVWLQQNPEAELKIPDQRLALDFDQPFDEKQKKNTYPSTDNLSMTGTLQRVDVEGTNIPRLLPAEGQRRAIVLDGDRGITAKGVDSFDRWTPFSLVITFRETQRESRRSILATHTRGTDAGFNGWDLSIVNGHVESRMYRVWPGNAIGVRTAAPISVDRWQQLTATYDGSSTAAGLKLYLDGQPLALDVLRDKVVKSANAKISHGGQLVIGQRFRSRGLAGGLIDDVRLYERELAPTEIAHLATGAPLTATPAYYASAIDEECRAAAKQLRAARQAYVMAEEVMQEVPIMEELDEPRPAHVLARGQYDAPTSDETLVSRQTFAKLGPAFPAGASHDRLGLAQWVTDPNHPLTARVVVNRLWNNFFGAGLVRTPENFGSQGELPTHPALLDWLARDFVAHGWDVKRFCKNVVLSATYRQDSAASSALFARDPDNRLLARGPAYRLGAEQIRDLALAASGLLSSEREGPPVSPYQPGKDLWKESNGMSPAYQQSVGQALHRRSLYSVWKRTAPLPNMMAFDTTSREVCTVRRSRTNTPLQALVLMNDVQFVEAARTLAERLLKDLDDDQQRLAAAFISFAGRQPDSTEQRVLLELLNEERTYYEAHTDEAKKLIVLGDTKPKEKTSATELAALTTVCQAILNLDATIWNR